MGKGCFQVVDNGNIAQKRLNMFQLTKVLLTPERSPIYLPIY